MNLFLHGLLWDREILEVELEVLLFVQLIQIIFWFPSGLFEIIIGIWLLVKGLNIQQTITEGAT